MLGVAGCLRSGACMVLRKKFSARNFASDCVKHKCTSMQYIGELCRYLCSTPPSLDEPRLTLKSAFGNGLRPEVWTEFQKRYQVEHIIEFYASTEGNLGLFNNTDVVGALGYVPTFCDFIYPIRILRTDPDDPTIPFRNADGRCEVCKPGEVGLLVGEINNNRVDRRFDGYTDKGATAKKVLFDVFKPKDSYFNTGDLLYRDKYGFFFWSDRTGDTFRWSVLQFI
jgi:acyl-CoA synthetase (AMP-forming)/AMP-acid ligase II